MNQIFSDVTNINSALGSKLKEDMYPAKVTEPKVTRNNPYAVKILPDDVRPAAEIFTEIFMELYESSKDDKIQKVIVQFKCHEAEYSSRFPVDIGTYVVVQGDRGFDIGVVISTEFVSNSAAPVGNLIGCASQKEVDYWATDLKKAEADALQICRQQISNLKLDMSVMQAEYQYDKKKLTLYYMAHDRVEYEILTKELFRQFGCRIWLVKVESAS